MLIVLDFYDDFRLDVEGKARSLNKGLYKSSELLRIFRTPLAPEHLLERKKDFRYGL